MATIRKEAVIGARPEDAWAALRDVGALHTRLVPGFVTDVRLEEGSRIVTFGDGIVLRELIVTIDDQARRLVWAAVGGRMTHHNAAAQVFTEGETVSRLVWTADLLPDDMAPAIAAKMEQAMPIIKATLERAATQPPSGCRATPPGPRPAAGG